MYTSLEQPTCLHVEKVRSEVPMVVGFSRYSECGLSDAQVACCLVDAFGVDQLACAQVSSIAKERDYLIFIPRNASHHFKVIIEDFVQLGVLRFRSSNVVSADSFANYSQVEQYLEGKDDGQELNHTYQVRATAGRLGIVDQITLHSFGDESWKKARYLQNLNFSQQEKQRLYVLGTIVHELAHRWEDATGVGPEIWEHLCKGDFCSWVEEQQFVSEYVFRHAVVYGSSPEIVLREELAESVRIFATNPRWLLKHHPRRYQLIQTYFSFLRPGVIQDHVQPVSWWRRLQ